MPNMIRTLFSTSPMMRGDDVLAVQRRLSTFGALSQDGLYGDGTATAVRNFQSSHNVEVDGIVGPVTWTALFQQPAAPPPRLPPDPLASGSLADLRAPHGYYKDGCTWKLGVDGIEV